MIEKCIENLKKNGFDASFFKEIQHAKDYILDMISNYSSFGIGGSDTVRSMNIVQALKEMGKRVYDHWVEDLSKEQDLEIRLMQGRCDCFLCSANAISASGEIVNVDGIGNRVSAMCFGPKKVVIVAGTNKIVPDLDSAIKRIKEIAAPLRAKSLGLNLPCAKAGRCVECNSPQSICRITTILHKKPIYTDISVIIVDKSLGY